MKFEMTTKEKRKHVTLTVAQKLELLELLEMGTSASKLSRLYGVGKSTITDIKKNKNKLREFALTNKENPAKRHTLKKAANPAFEDALKTWFLQEQMLGTAISSTLLADKARSLYKEMTGKDDFLASKGWLHRFKNRFGVRQSSVIEETVCVNSYLLQQYCVSFIQEVEEMGLCPEQVYCAADAQAFWQMLPINTSTVINKRESYEKQLTFMPCANALGTHKIRLLLIERTENPPFFKDVNLPFCYRSQENAELTSEIIKHWFDTEFVPSVRQHLRNQGLPERALLVLNMSGHLLELTSSDGQITTTFLPLDIAPSLQPLQQKIIQIMKTYYCKKLLLKIMADKCENLQLAIKNITLSNAACWFSEAWEAQSATVINQSWRQLWPTIVCKDNENCSSEGEATEVRNMLSTIFWTKNCEDKEFMDPPETTESSPNSLIDGGLVECILNEEPNNDNSQDCGLTPTISHLEAADYFGKCLQWAEENGASLVEMTTLKQLQERAMDMVSVVHSS